MNELIKYVGVIILLIGVAVLAVPFLGGGITNSLLLIGLLLIVAGFFVHIFLNKKLE